MSGRPFDEEPWDLWFGLIAFLGMVLFAILWECRPIEPDVRYIELKPAPAERAP